MKTPMIEVEKRMGLFKKERGSITLEAAVVMPIFILFIVFLIFMIRFALIDIAINQATSETAKNVATQVYPAKRLVDVAMDKLEPSGKYAEIISDAKGIADDIISGFEQLGLTEEFYDIVGSIGDAAEDAGNDAISSVASGVVHPLILNELESAIAIGFVDADKVNTKRVAMGEGFKYVELVVEYEVELPIPFLERTFKLQKKAYERLWTGS